MSETASMSTSVAARYATALFELTREGGDEGGLERDVDLLESLLAESEDFRTMIGSPIYSRDAQEQAVAAIADHVGLSDAMGKTLRLMATKRRLFAVPQLVRELRARISDEKGQVVAEVAAARPLTEEQRRRLIDTLNSSDGREIILNTTVDERLIGGLVVKVGSKMIDTSIRSKLAALENTMKEAG